MIVVDAGVWVRALVEQGPAGDACRAALSRDPEWAAPAHAALEALRTLWRYERAGVLTVEAANAHAAAVRDAEVLYAAPVPWLLAATWRTRHNVSVHDAPYVALASRYGVPLVTVDERLARAARSLQVDVLVPADT